MAGGDTGAMRGTGEPWLPEGRQSFAGKLRQLAAPVVKDRGVRILPAPGAAPLLLLPRFLVGLGVGLGIILGVAVALLMARVLLAILQVVVRNLQAIRQSAFERALETPARRRP